MIPATTSATAGAPHDRGCRRPPTLAVTAAVVVLLTLIGVVVPAVGHQLGLSFSRQSAAYIELYFAGTSSSAEVHRCGTVAGQATTRFTLVSHSDVPHKAKIDYRVVARPLSGQRTHETVLEGTRSLTPGEATTVSATLAARASRALEVEVSLPTTGAEINMRCDRAGA